MAIGGKAATVFYENERTFDVMLRFEQQFRNDEQKIGDILIPTMDGKQVPLKEIADIKFVTGPAFIYREGSSRYVGIGFSIRDRDLGSTIDEAQAKVERLVHLPEGSKIQWAGEFESQQRATKRLAVVVPAVLLLILFLLYMNFGTVKDTLIAASTMPYALCFYRGIYFALGGRHSVRYFGGYWVYHLVWNSVYQFYFAHGTDEIAFAAKPQYRFCNR